MTTEAAPTREQIQAFLLKAFAAELKMDAADIHPDKPLLAYGLDSTGAVGISGELEKWLAIRFPPTLLYDHPTVAALATAVLEKLRSRTPATAPER